GAAGMQELSAKGTASDLFGAASLAGVVTATGLNAQGVTGNAVVRVDGKPDKLGLRLSSDLKDGDDGKANITAAAQLDLPGQKIVLTAFNGDWRGAALTLAAPATIDFSRGLAVDRLSAQIGGGDVVFAGRVLPVLAFNASLRNVALDAFKSFLPQLSPQGTVSATVALTGAPGAPQGTITVQGRDLRARGISSRQMPSAAIDARAELLQGQATLTASLTAGNNSRLTITGNAPLAMEKAMDLHLAGSLDLAMLDPFLAAAGRRVRGTATFDATAGGSVNAPRLSGSAKLSDGEFQDYLQGIRIQAISAEAEAQGTAIRVTRFSGRAGHGSIEGSGTIDLAAADTPVNFAIQAKNARPVVSDLITATLSGDAEVSGSLKGLLRLSGHLQVIRADINLPENFPPDIAVLDLRRRGQKPRPPPSRSQMTLDVAIRTTGPIFVRGHGVDAELGGGIKLSGTSAAPVISGDFRMIRGTYSIAGQTLDFTSGKIGFDGTGVRNRLDPTLDFVAQTVSGGVTATLMVTGYASAPKIALSSTPPLPQDEVLSHLLFQQSVKQLTPLQLASMGQSLVALGGVGSGFNPLGVLRKTFGLDRLAVGSAAAGASGSESQTTVEAGRYVMRNVYIGVKQNLSGGTQTQVQVDIIRGLKAQATVSTSASATIAKGSAQEDNGSNIGLSYQFEY
ncbi:MAG TPA: translocation/assembly module TamB domain-containing protein, partial [Rhizomicrobium sp.]